MEQWPHFPWHEHEDDWVQPDDKEQWPKLECWVPPDTAWLTRFQYQLSRNSIQFQILVRSLRSTPRRGNRASTDELDPNLALTLLIALIDGAGKDGVRASLIERRLCCSLPGDGHTITRGPLIRNRSKVHRWLHDLEGIGFLEKKTFKTKTKRSKASKAREDVYYRVTRCAATETIAFWDFDSLRLEDQIVSKPFLLEGEMPALYNIDVPKLAIVACRRLQIAKDLLHMKGKVIDPDADIDALYASYYDEIMPDLPRVNF